MQNGSMGSMNDLPFRRGSYSMKEDATNIQIVTLKQKVGYKT
jgi:hypothetical protein